MIVPSVTHVSSVTVTDIGSDYLTVQVESGEESGAFDVTCSDAYGNQVEYGLCRRRAKP